MNELPTIQGSLLKASEVAKLFNISRSLAYQLMQRGDVPAVRFGGIVRVRASDLDEYIRRSWSGWKQD